MGMKVGNCNLPGVGLCHSWTPVSALRRMRIPPKAATWGVVCLTDGSEE